MIKVAGIRVADEKLCVIIEGETGDEVVSADARRMAYDERRKHGFEQAGLDAIARPYAIDRTKLNKLDDNAGVCTLPDQLKEAMANKTLAFRAEYILTRMLV